MRKFVLSFVVLSIAILLSLISCSIESLHEKEVNDAKSILSIEQEDVEILPEYFDFIGEAHNLGLDYAYYNAIQNNSDLNYFDVREASLYYFDNIYDLTLEMASSNYTSEHDLIVKQSVESNSIFLESFDYSKFSEIELDFLKQLDDILSSEAELNYKLEKIDLLNQNIYDSQSDLTDIQLTRLYMTNSVAKHSLSYWNSESADKWLATFPLIGMPIATDSPTYPIEASSIDWDMVATVDIAAFLKAFPAGAKAGAVKGAIVLGLASGGTGAIPGYIIGAIGGGAAAGISAAVVASGSAIAAQAVVKWIGDWW